MFSLQERLNNKVYSEEIDTYSFDYDGTFNEKNILLTGASGLIGVPLVDVLMRCSDANIYALCRNKKYAEEIFAPYLRHKNFQLLIGSVDTFNFLHYSFDYLIHAAGGADPKTIAADPVGVMKANIGGIVNLLEYGRSHKCRILYVSSGEIYGQDVLGKGKFSEDYYGYIDTKKPRSSYPESKRASETFCASYKEEYGVDVIIGRLCHVYGPTMKPTDSRVVAEFITDAAKGLPIIMKSEGLQKRSFCYVFDVVSAFLFLLLHGETGVFYNITGGEESVKRIREMAELVGIIGKVETKIKPVSLDYKNQYAGFDHAYLDNQRLVAMNWKAKHSFESGMRHTIRILKGTE